MPSENHTTAPSSRTASSSRSVCWGGATLVWCHTLVWSHNGWGRRLSLLPAPVKVTCAKMSFSRSYSPWRGRRGSLARAPIIAFLLRSSSSTATASTCACACASACASVPTLPGDDPTKENEELARRISGDISGAEMRISESEIRLISGEELELRLTRRSQLGRISGDEPELGRISGRLSAPSKSGLGARIAARSSLPGASSEGSTELAGNWNASSSGGVLSPRDMHMRMGARTAQLPTLSLRDTPDSSQAGEEAALLGSGYSWATGGDPLREGAPGNLDEGDADEIFGGILRGPSGNGDPGEILPEESLGKVVRGKVKR